MNGLGSGSSPDEAVGCVRSGDRIFVHGAAATPSLLLDALASRLDLEGVRVYHLHLAGDLLLFKPNVEQRIRSISFFAGANARASIEAGRSDFMPIFLSDIPALFRTRSIPLDVAIVQLSPPDRHGNMTLGTSCDAAYAAVESANIVLAEINERMPRTHGANVVHITRVTKWVSTNRPLPTSETNPIGHAEEQIGELVANLIEDRATLQMGIGAIPDAVLAKLGNKLDLGVHTEMFSDGLLPLLENRVVTNRYKALHPNRSVTSFLFGSQRLYDHVHDNQLVELHPCDRTNDTSLIRKIDKMTAINSALEIDLTGQVCADSVGHKIFSGIGGQMDFVRGASLSRGGKAIIALPSTAAHGSISRIVPTLKAGAGVVTTRGHLHWVVTEFGARNLHGLTLPERAEALIDLAHPDFRSELKRHAREVRHFNVGG